MKDNTILWNVNLFETARSSDTGVLLVDRHQGVPSRIEADLSAQGRRRRRRVMPEAIRPWPLTFRMPFIYYNGNDIRGFLPRPGSLKLRLSFFSGALIRDIGLQALRKKRTPVGGAPQPSTPGHNPNVS